MPIYEYHCNRCGWTGDKVVHFGKNAGRKDGNLRWPPAATAYIPIGGAAALTQPMKEKGVPPPQTCNQVVLVDAYDTVRVDMLEPAVHERIVIEANLGRTVEFGGDVAESAITEGAELTIKYCGGGLVRNTAEIPLIGATPYAWRP